MEVVPYQPKTLDYDFVVEEFKAEYKLDVKRLKEIYKEYCSEPNEDLYDEWYHLFPEFNEIYGDIKIEEFDIKQLELNDRVLKTCHFLQSDKDKFTNPIQHYSLQEIMLANLQDERNKYKKLMGQAIKNKDSDSTKRFNAMQLALKVNMNSIYGASNNAVFPHYDPDIAAAITWSSRQCIKQLTEGLVETVMYVDQEFLDSKDVQNYLNDLDEIRMIKIEKLDESEYDTIPRRRSLRRLFTDTYRVDHSKIIYRITKEPCELVYQDTDSNYFECHAVQKYYLGAALNSKNPEDNDISKFKCSPDLLNIMMKKMVSLDNLLCKLVVEIIDRRPIGLGFEGSFIVCRYLNRKKKYYGVKAADDDGNVFTDKLSNPDAYDSDGKLVPDYDKYWTPKNKCIPLSNGEFIQIDDSKILQTDANYLDYIQSMGVKVTGVDLTRRDTYRFINYCHLKILQKDLRICSYDTEKLVWNGISLKEEISNVVMDVIENFKTCYNQFIKVANFQSDTLPSPHFNIRDFTKNNRHNKSSNPASMIIKRYEGEIRDINARIVEIENEKSKLMEDIADLDKDVRDEDPRLVGDLRRGCPGTGYPNAEPDSASGELVSPSQFIKISSEIEKLDKSINDLQVKKTRIEGYIPFIGDRLFYVIMENKLTEEQTSKGIKAMIKNKDASVSLNEMFDILKIDQGFNEEYFSSHVGQLNLTFDQWFNAKCVSSLYLKHYLFSLAKALSTYMFGEKYPDIAQEIDSGIFTDKEKNTLIQTKQDAIAQEIVDKYFPRIKTKKIVSTKLTTVRVTRSNSNINKVYDLADELFGRTFKIREMEVEQISELVHRKKNYYESLLSHAQNVIIRIQTNIFIKNHIFTNKVEKMIYEKYGRRFMESNEFSQSYVSKIADNLSKCSTIVKILEVNGYM